MKIYVVRPGDSVWSISRSFGVTPDSIINANGGPQYTSNLVVGQTLIIPSSERPYRVQAGDSLYSIARQFEVSVDSIIELNNLTAPYILSLGQVLRIPEKSKNYGYIESNAFIQPTTPERDKRVTNEAIQYLTYISPFSHHVNADGSLTPINDATVLEIAKDNKVAPLLSVTNLSESNFDTQLGHKILNDDKLSQTVIDNMIAMLKDKGYYGVLIDFERIPPEDREKYNNFLRKVVAQLHPLGYVVGTALAPKTYDVTEGAWHGAHDYKAHGEIVDFVVIMTYEWGWSGGPPMAVAPIDQVKKVLDYAVTVIPPKKILMGVPLYGYDWTLPYTPGGEFAESIGNQEAITRAGKHGAIIKYDEKAQSPYYNYTDKGRQHVVWFEDARSVEAKYKLASQLGLRGVSYWVLAQPFPQNWQVLDDMFKITKVIR